MLLMLWFVLHLLSIINLLCSRVALPHLLERARPGAVGLLATIAGLPCTHIIATCRSATVLCSAICALCCLQVILCNMLMHERTLGSPGLRGLPRGPVTRGRTFARGAGSAPQRARPLGPWPLQSSPDKTPRSRSPESHLRIRALQATCLLQCLLHLMPVSNSTWCAFLCVFVC